MTNTVNTAVTNVTPIRTKGKKDAAVPVVTGAESKPHRGRPQQVLKNGQPLAEARSQAKQAITVAKVALKEAAGLESANSKQLALINKEVDKLQARVAELQAAQASLKEHLALQKTMTKTAAQLAKETAKASTALDRANEAAAKIEDSVKIAA